MFGIPLGRHLAAKLDEPADDRSWISTVVSICLIGVVTMVALVLLVPKDDHGRSTRIVGTSCEGFAPPISARGRPSAPCLPLERRKSLLD